MNYIDSHAHLEMLTWQNLKDMYLAGVRVIVSPAHLAAAKPVSNETIKDIWDYALEIQLNRANEHFITAYTMLGISMVSTPRNNFKKLLEWLPKYLERPE